MECLLKICAYGRKKFFADQWNTFDFVIGLIGVGSIVIESQNSLLNVSSIKVIRVMRLTRLLRILKFVKMLQVVTTFMQTLPALINIGSLLLLFVFIYSIVGINLFA